MTLDNWRTTGNYFEYKGSQIFYQRGGKGPVLLLLHGFPTASWDFHSFWKPLQQHFTVLAIDFIGFGFSDKPPKHPYSIFDQANLTEQFLEQQQVKTYHVLSHDYGDTVAQELVARNNERKNDPNTNQPKLLSLCLLNGGLFPETHQALFIQKIMMGPLGVWVANFFTKGKLKKNFQKIFGPNTQPQENDITAFWELMVYKNGKRVFPLLIRYMRERKTYRQRWVGALQQTTIPLYLINGTSDPISGKHMVARYRELIPNPQVTELDSIGHYPQLEAPSQVMQCFLDFFNRIEN